MNGKALVRRLGLGRAVYRLWHAPLGALKTSFAAGGPVEQWRDRRAHAEMTAAAAQLPPQTLPPPPGWPEVHFLTGARFWDQTALCLYTLQAHAGHTLHSVVHDDGTLTPPVVRNLRRIFPQMAVCLRSEDEVRASAALPAGRFPTLQAERHRPYPNMLKLTDVHAGSHGWKLVLDSDMLFFRRPDFLLDWLRAPDRPLHLVDVKDSYGYSRPLLESLAGAPLPSRLNVGFCGLRSDAFDWEKLEFWSRRLVEMEGSSYYLEQALGAMLCAGGRCAVAPVEDYQVLPLEAECRAPRAVLHHYVAGSKRGYFRYAWRVALACSAVRGALPPSATS